MTTRSFFPVVLFLIAIGTAFVARDTLTARLGLTRDTSAPLRNEAVASISDTSFAGQDDDDASYFALLEKKDDGYFWAEARIDGHFIDFVVDTGAQVVALTPQDARRLNLDTGERDVEVITASGHALASRVIIDEIIIGPVRVRDVEAVVMDEDLRHSLLGMSFLNRVSRWEARRNTLVIHQ